MRRARFRKGPAGHGPSQKGDDCLSRDFEAVKDPGEARQFLWEAAKTASATLIWTKDHGFSFQSYVSEYHQDGAVLDIVVPRGTDPANLLPKIDPREHGPCYVSISLQRANIFFRSEPVGVGPDILRFRAPDVIFKVQRREDFRLRIPDSQELMLEFQNPLAPDGRVAKRILDLSARGAAIAVDENEHMNFSPKTILKDALLVLNGRNVTFDAEVRHVRSIRRNGKPTGTVKVGLLFCGLRQGDSQVIASYVFEESRKYFARFI